MKKLAAKIKSNKRLLLYFSLFTIVATLAFNHKKTTEEILSAPFIVAAYYQNVSQYRPENGDRPVFFPALIDTDLLTDLYFAFATLGYIGRTVDPDYPGLTGDFTVQPTMWNDQSELYPQLQALKAKSKHGLRTFLTIGGATFNDPYDDDGMESKTYHLFSKMISNQENRKQFIDSAIAYAHQYQFDGIDIDWEYPGDLARGGTEKDFENLVVFFKECSEAFHRANPPLLLSFAASPFPPEDLLQQYNDDHDIYYQWLAKFAAYLDRISILAYDYHSPGDGSDITGVNAPLHRDTNPTSSLYIDNTLQTFLKNGVPPEKIVLGIPFYGHSYGGVEDLSPENSGPGKPFWVWENPDPVLELTGYLTYFEISDMIASGYLTFAQDRVTSTVYGYNLSTRQWVSYDNPQTIKLKAQEVINYGLAGVVCWAIDMDEYYKEPTYPNIRSAYNVFYPLQLQEKRPNIHRE